MYQPNFIIFYVNNLDASRQFYETILGKKPTAVHPAFVVFSLNQDFMLGLWVKAGVTPEAMPPGGSELTFYLHNVKEVNTTLANIQNIGGQLLQAPECMDFGYTFTCLDLDGHRLRFFTPVEGWEWLSPANCNINEGQHIATSCG